MMHAGHSLTRVLTHSLSHLLPFFPCVCVVMPVGGWQVSDPVIITGATGPKAAKVNGTYKPTGDEHNGHPVYHNPVKDMWLHYASDELKGDREVVLAAVQQDGYTLGFAPDQLKGDREVVLAAVQQNGNALYYASDELQEDEEMRRAAGQL